jgi:hypothetical protein
MKMAHETDNLPQPYTPTPDGFERRLRAWVRLPMDDETTPAPGEVNPPPKVPGARAQARGNALPRNGHRRRRGRRSDA